MECNLAIGSSRRREQMRRKHKAALARESEFYERNVKPCVCVCARLYGKERKRKTKVLIYRGAVRKRIYIYSTDCDAYRVE